MVAIFFSFLKDCYIIFHSCWTILYLCQGFQFFHIFSFFLSFLLSILTSSLSFPSLFLPHSDSSHHVGVKCYHIMVLICIFLTVMLSIIMCVLLVIFISSLRNVCSSSLPIVLCCCWMAEILYIVWILTPYQVYDSQIFFSHFFLSLILFDGQKFLILGVIYLFLFLLPLLLVSYPTNHCQNSVPAKPFPMFSSKCFIV